VGEEDAAAPPDSVRAKFTVSGRPPVSDSTGLEIAALSAGERAELARLRDEIVALRTPRSRRIRWKPVVAGLLLVIGCLLAPVALATVWVHNQVANTDRFVATAGPLIREPAVQAAITDRVTDAVFTYVDVQTLANDAVNALATQGLPAPIAERLHGFTGPLAASVRGFVHTKVGELVASPQLAQTWDRTIRLAHEQADAVLSGSASAVSIRGSEVVLDLAPFIDSAKQQLTESGLTVAGRIPEIHPTIAIGDAETLVKARTAYSTLDRLATWLPWVSVALLTSGVYLARGHRRALLATGLGVAAGMLMLATSLTVTRAVLVDSVPSRSADATATTFDVLVRFLRDGLRTVLVLGLVIALGAFLTGPSVTAVRLRASATRFLAWLRERGGRASLPTSRVGPWVHTHRGALRGAAVALAVLVFIFLNRPSGLAVLMIATVLLACLAVIQFVAQPPPEAPRH
jgi:hypothetical protein